MENALMWIGIVIGAGLGLLGLYWAWIRITLTEAPATSERFNVRTADGWTIRACRYRDAARTGPPVIICHGIMANQFSFTAPKGDSLVDVLVERGFDCWVMDCRGTRSSSPPVNASRYDARASDYALEDMPAMIEFVRGHTGFPRVHWIGHSMGGMMLYMYLAAFGGGAIASGTTLGSPPGVGHFKPQPVGGLLFMSGLMPVVVEFIWRCGSVLFKVLKVNSPLAPINWNNVDPRVKSKTFFNMVEFLPYPAARELTSWILEKRWAIHNGEIDVEANFPKMDAPLLLVYGSDDVFTPAPRAHALFNSLPGRDKRFLMLGPATGCHHDYSHVDLVLSPNGRTELYGPVADWIEAHSAASGAGKPIHAMPHAHTPLELDRPVKPAKPAPKKRKKSSRAMAVVSRSARETGASKTSGGQYATQKKVAGKKKAAQRKTARRKTAAKKSVKKKTASKKKPAVKKTAKTKPVAKKKSAKKKPAHRKRG